MIIDFDVQSKSDEELIGIWTDQNNFVDEVVMRAKAEIDRRKLDVSGMHVPTPVEIDHAVRLRADTTLARECALYLMAGFAYSSVSLYMSGFVSVLDWVLCVGLFLSAVGIWKAKRWALLPGMILCAVEAMLCAVIVFGNVFAMMFLKFSVPDLILLFWQACYLAFSIVVLPCLLSLWKRDARLESIVWISTRDGEQTR